jgi:cobalt-precorrin 5A hydrolase
VAAAAARFGRPLVLIPAARLKAAGSRAVSRSERVVQLFAVPSVAEAAALAAAGEEARILVPRRASGGATCALAAEGSGP